MNPRKTWLLAGLAVGIFLYIVLYEWRADRQHARESGGRLFSDFSAAAVTSVEVVFRTNQLLRVERTNDDWRLVLPFEYPAHATRIEHLLAVFGLLDRQTHISAQELAAQNQPLATFGLDPPRATLVAQTAVSRLELKVGGITPVGSQVYVQVVGSDGIFFTDASLLDRLPESVDDWRDPTFLPLKNLNFTRLEVRAGSGGFEVQIDPSTQLWRLTNPLVARADNRKLAALIHQLNGWQVSRFIPNNPKPDLEALGLQAPELVLAFGQGSNDVLVVRFGKSPTNDPTCVFAQRPPLMNVVQVPRAPLDQLRMPLGELRESHLISAPLVDVGIIEVEGREKFVLQRQNDGSWRVTAPVNFPADPDLVREFLSRLSALPIVKFEKDVVTDFSSYGLVPPTRRYTLKTGLTNTVSGPTNRLIAQLDFGTNQSARIFARLSNEDSVYATKLESFMDLPDRAFQLHERRLWTFESTNVSEVVITLQGQVHKLVRNKLGHWALAGGGALNNALDAALEEALHRFGELRSEFWVSQGEDRLEGFGFTKTAHSLSLVVAVGKQSRTLTLDFGYQAPSKNILASTVLEGQRLIFELKLSTFQLYEEIWRSVAKLAPKAPPR